MRTRVAVVAALIIAAWTLAPVAATAQDGSISGWVTDPTGAAVAGATVMAYGVTVPYSRASGDSSADGSYQIGGLGAGEYKVLFLAPIGSDLASEFYDSTLSFDEAVRIAVAAGADTSGIDAALDWGGAISGTIVDQLGAPIAGVAIRASAGNDVEDFEGELDRNAITTAADGTYRVAGRSGGYYFVRFQAPASSAYLSRDYPTPVVVIAGATAAGIDGVLPAGGSIAGTVTDEAGAPIMGVVVLASERSHLGFGTDVTAADGSYRISGLEPSSQYIVEFYPGPGATVLGEWYDNKPARSAADDVVVTSGETTDVDAVLARGGVIAGRVVGPDGSPVAGVQVLPAGGLEPGVATTSADGTYEVAGLYPGEYRVEFRPPSGSPLLGEWFDGKRGRESADPVAVAGGATRQGIDASLQLGGAIAGRVLGPDGLPLAGVAVRVGTFVFPRPLAGESLTGPDGSYRVQGLHTGQYRVAFSPPPGSRLLGEFYSGQTDVTCAALVTVTAGSTTERIDARLRLGGTITGRVVAPDGRPPRDAFVSVYASSATGGGGFATVDADGTYRIDGLFSGRYLVSFDPWFGGELLSEYYDGAARVAAARLVPVNTGSTTTGIDATLEAGGRITGRVTDSAGDPFRWVRVSAQHTDPDVLDRSGDTSTGLDGTFVIAGLRPGDYRVLFEDFEERIALSELYDDQLKLSRAALVRVSSGTTTGGIDASLDRLVSEWTGAIAGRLVVPDGAPASGEVTAQPVNDSGIFGGGGAHTDAEGRYLVSGLREGEYRVSFRPDSTEQETFVGELYSGQTGAASATRVTVRARVTATAIDGALHAAGGIAGRVVDPGGAPVAAQVRVLHTTPGALTAEEVTETEPDGTYVLHGLQAGEYRVAFAPLMSSDLEVRWYDGKPGSASADRVTVAAGSITSGIDAQLRRHHDPPQPPVCPQRP